MKATALLFLTTLLCYVASFAQGDTTTPLAFKRRQPYKETAVKLLVGGNIQQAMRADGTEYERKFFEIGIHKTYTAFGGIHPPSAFTHGLSVEIAPLSTPIYGFKYSAWAEVWIAVLGLSSIYYTDFHHGNFKLRPELGIGAWCFKLTGGYNIPTLWNKDFAELRRSNIQVTLNILLKLKTISRKDYP